MYWKTCILHLLVLISLYIHVLYNINLVLFIVQEFTHLLYFKKIPVLHFTSNFNSKIFQMYLFKIDLFIIFL